MNPITKIIAMKKNLKSALPLLVLSVSLNAFSAPPPAAGDIYKAKCVMCHGADGAGTTPMGQKFKIRDLRSADVQKQSDDQLTAIITDGKTPMPAYGKSLAPGDIKQLVAFIRSIAKS